MVVIKEKELLKKMQSNENMFLKKSQDIDKKGAKAILGDKPKDI